MRIRSVTAHAFGPLSEQTLDFADGLTVVYGPNESAKSSWHAATYAALCGRQRRAGGPSADDRRFEERHRPWDGAQWLVSASVVLDDGRRVELRQDLADRVACDAIDVGLGRDVSAEIMNDGTPDAARWLGLDRTSFRATACVAQTQVLGVLEGADGLQAHLQRAASTAGGDQPADAIERVREFQAQAVGGERAHAKPLRRAIDGQKAAAEALKAARVAHADYERKLLDVQRTRRAAAEADRLVHRQEWLLADRAAAELRERADEAERVRTELASLAHNGVPGTERDAIDVAAALRAWEHNPPAPAPVEMLIRTAFTDDELVELAHDLDTRVPDEDPQLPARVTAAQERLLQARRRSRIAWWLGGLALIFAIGAAAAVVLAQTVPGDTALTLPAFGGLGAAAVLAVLAVVVGLRGGRPAAARTALTEAEAALIAQGESIAAALATLDAAAARCEEAGLSADADELRRIARGRAERAAHAERDRHWQDETRRSARNRLLAAVHRLGLEIDETQEPADVLQAWLVSRFEATTQLDETRALESRLAVVYGDLTADEFAERIAVAQQRADRMRSALPVELTEEVDTLVLDFGREAEEDELARQRVRARAAAEDARAAEVTLAERSATATPVGEAEERLAHAEAEVARIRELGETLTLTLGFLTRAQERAHRTIAARLNESLHGRLEQITGGRYSEVAVDPTNLAVKVRGGAGRWRKADLLSFGTAEQVYLMLRIALAEHLTADGVSCPLIFDDVTVHADRARTASILELLRDASGQRQIIVFTQQEQVRDWARDNLVDGPDAIRELTPVAAV